MNNLPGSFGKIFLASGFVPALIFIGLNDFIVIPLFLQNYLIDLKFLGLEGGAYILGAILLGLILLSLNTFIIRFYQTGLLPKLSRKRYLQKHKNLYTALNSLRKNYQDLKNQGKDLPEEAISKLETVYSTLEKSNSGQSLPYNPNYIMPTALGNAFAVMTEYPYHRYGMDLSLYWPRLISVIPTEYYNKITDYKASLDFYINLSFILIILSLESLVVGLLFLTIQPIIYGTIMLVVSWFLYRAGTNAAFTLGDWVKSCFDVFRLDLLKKYNKEIPEAIANERELWLRLGSFILRGEDFYYPCSPQKNNTNIMD